MLRSPHETGDDEEQRRFDAILRQPLNTPPQPRSEMKLGKTEA
jgi:hypothetical protein